MDPAQDLFPPLPALNPPEIWSINIQNAHHTLSTAYNSSQQLLQLDDSDALRLRFHAERIENEIVPVLEAMETHVEIPCIPRAWLESAAYALGHLIVRLSTAIVGVEEL